MIEMRTTQESGKTPEKITVSMIDQDLKDGVSKSDMAVKYGIKPWEVDEMFKHPFLKGRRPSRKKALSFSFVDDVTTTIEAEVTTDPNQVTLEDAIDEAVVEAEEAKETFETRLAEVKDVLTDERYENQLDREENDPEYKELELEEEDNTFEL